jgi:hypothetical protein
MDKSRAAARATRRQAPLDSHRRCGDDAGKVVREGGVIKAAGLVLIVIALTCAQIASADECGDAVRDYNAVMNRLEDAMQKFTGCTAGSLGRDSCTAEFRKLQSAYAEYESAVTIYKKQCL